jgi:hypothetical protein
MDEEDQRWAEVFAIVDAAVAAPLDEEEQQRYNEIVAELASAGQESVVPAPEPVVPAPESVQPQGRRILKPRSRLRHRQGQSSASTSAEATTPVAAPLSFTTVDDEGEQGWGKYLADVEAIEGQAFDDEEALWAALLEASNAADNGYEL